MREPIFVRPLSDEERQTLKAGLRSSDAFLLRRCQILLASNQGQNAYPRSPGPLAATTRPCATSFISSTRRASRRRFSEGLPTPAYYLRSVRPEAGPAAQGDAAPNPEG